MTALAYRALALVVLMLVSTVAHGADGRGMFSVKSVGTVNCQRYLDARKEQGKEYLLFAGYVSGHITAYNQLSPETFDILPWQSVETILGMLASFCDKNPDRNFAVAVIELIKILRPNRLKSTSELVEVRTQHGSIQIYRETLRRVQTQLVKLGHYQGSVDGEFGPKTRRGLEQFQTAKGLKKTGLPDQQTLFSLLVIERPTE
jgi:hypothetical protein